MVCISGTLNLQPFTSRGPNIVAQIVLLVVFLSFFGMPAIERFLKKDVIIVETLKKTDGIPTPAITISVPKQPRNHSCFNKNVSIEDCLEKKLFKAVGYHQKCDNGVNPSETGQSDQRNCSWRFQRSLCWNIFHIILAFQNWNRYEKGYTLHRVKSKFELPCIYPWPTILSVYWQPQSHTRRNTKLLQMRWHQVVGNIDLNWSKWTNSTSRPAPAMRIPATVSHHVWGTELV